MPYLYKHFIDLRLNVAENKYKWSRKFENVHTFKKCTLQYICNMLQSEIDSPMPSNKTAQQNSQHYTKLHIEVHKEVYNLLHNKIYWKIDFSLCFGFVKQVKNKVYIPN